MRGSEQYQRRHRLYITWWHMVQRCEKPTHCQWKNYGARGIIVCDRWRKSFRAFLQDMGPRPPGLTLERKNNDGNYEPLNCCWATWSQQRINQRRNKRLSWAGQTKTISEWARITGVSFWAIKSRVFDRKWPIEKALSTPTNQPRFKKILFRGEKRKVGGWAKILGIKKTTLYRRVSDLKWTWKRALSTPVKKIERSK